MIEERMRALLAECAKYKRNHLIIDTAESAEPISIEIDELVELLGLAKQSCDVTFDEDGNPSTECGVGAWVGNYPYCNGCGRRVVEK